MTCNTMCDIILLDVIIKYGSCLKTHFAKQLFLQSIQKVPTEPYDFAIESKFGTPYKVIFRQIFLQYIFPIKTM